MTHYLEANALLSIAYWALMVPIAAYVLIRVNGFFIDDFPTTFLRAIGLVLATAAVMFVVYDLTGYAFVRLMEDPQVGYHVPQKYSYLDWLREPIGLKWQVLSALPFVR